MYRSTDKWKKIWSLERHPIMYSIYNNIGILNQWNLFSKWCWDNWEAIRKKLSWIYNLYLYQNEFLVDQLYFLKVFLKDFIYSREGVREGERGRETSVRERNIDQLAFCMPLTGDWTLYPAMCPDQELTRWLPCGMVPKQLSNTSQGLSGST